MKLYEVKPAETLEDLELSLIQIAICEEPKTGFRNTFQRQNFNKTPLFFIVIRIVDDFIFFALSVKIETIKQFH